MPITVNAITIIHWLSGVTLPTGMPIHDTTPDPGVIGPGSVTWKIHSEQWLILGGAQAFLLQAAHPVVAQGAIDHSAYAEDPFGRVYRTVTGMSILICGSTHEVNATAHVINRLHQTVTGTLTETIGPYHTGQAYSALDAGPLLWVHVAFVESMLTAYRRFVGPISDAECERYWQESCHYARRLGLTDAVLPPSYAAMRQYLDQAIANHEVIVSAGARTIAQTILFPPVPWHRKPVWALVRLLAAGQLPAPIREGYGLRWSWRDRLGFGLVSGMCRLTRILLPGILGHSPMIAFAEQRSRGALAETTSHVSSSVGR
jgi:uncharacterized protein (DUF2236 family)